MLRYIISKIKIFLSQIGTTRDAVTFQWNPLEMYKASISFL